MNKLYYVYDPMCSWCWGFKPVWEKIEQALSGEIEIVYLLGGLAPDSDQAMPMAMQLQIAAYWRRIEALLGTEFNHEFWALNTPRRSTYPACRAILAARAQQAEGTMLTAIQKAYYLQARNPSDNEVLIDLASKVGLDKTQFSADLLHEETQEALLAEIHFARSIGGNSFPSLFVQSTVGITPISIDYQDVDACIAQIREAKKL
ncbi:DsbA family protein [Shewanella insulae]|uniref:DsbA family protein n=1 Tax=Shewanella insulae TaxID=2681496 RepID=UPI001EFD7E7E|nr:DsbA family protein [Shewanella insulae]MCG9739665.1 DsbA family protein [Shewanella insulae]MCG9754616.1 DsbA family protein [Shewanella insulae]